MHAFISECLRCYTPVPNLVPRVALFDHKIGDFEVKKGDFVDCALYSNFMNENYFENPEEFKPERFLEK